jgi:hypothetical protein
MYFKGSTENPIDLVMDICVLLAIQLSFTKLAIIILLNKIFGGFIMDVFIIILMFGSLIGAGIILPFICKFLIEKQINKLQIIIFSIFVVIFTLSVILDLKLYAETYTLDLILAMFLVLFSTISQGKPRSNGFLF